MPQIVQANILKPGTLPDALPGLLEAHEMPPFQAGQDVRVAFHSGDFGQGFERGGSQGYHLGSGLGVGQPQTPALRIDVFPFERQDFRFPRSGQDQESDRHHCKRVLAVLLGGRQGIA